MPKPSNKTLVKLMTLPLDDENNNNSDTGNRDPNDFSAICQNEINKNID